MTYDWSGERTRRMRLLRIATAVILVALVVSIPLLTT
ncbi:hypothetical protein GGD56_004980 [Rhizobium mongolense]|uniref:Uncharacterized protein n=2 Tax=Rhizobium mongolense TaxID=57676 RepID=A0ABR6IU55_9HYPH|nr:hypothetical protein [Rhizobium mongolense]TVZ66589.1 hypothetical protein BCL32_6970 [Rhizobium mongolense USDA 1844]